MVFKTNLNVKFKSIQVEKAEKNINLIIDNKKKLLFFVH